MADDVELEVSHADLKEALVTKIGGRTRKEGEERDEGKTSHHDNSASGVNVAQGIWASSNDGSREPSFVQPKAVDEVLQAAKASQRRENSMHGAIEEASMRGAFRGL
jgi:hypothetical protein